MGPLGLRSFVCSCITFFLIKFITKDFATQIGTDVMKICFRNLKRVGLLLSNLSEVGLPSIALPRQVPFGEEKNKVLLHLFG